MPQTRRALAWLWTLRGLALLGMAGWTLWEAIAETELSAGGFIGRVVVIDTCGREGRKARLGRGAAKL